MEVIHPLQPIYNKHSKILILGSIPSSKSREIGFYYAHPQNRFWKIFEVLFNVTFNNTEDKINFLLNNNIALWDAFKSVEITNSSDSSIKKYKLNDLDKIIKESNIKAIFCTGKASYNSVTKNYKTNLPIIYLPSTSSANASFSLKDLIDEYQQILKYLKK